MVEWKLRAGRIEREGPPDTAGGQALKEDSRMSEAVGSFLVEAGGPLDWVEVVPCRHRPSVDGVQGLRKSSSRKERAPRPVRRKRFADYNELSADRQCQDPTGNGAGRVAQAAAAAETLPALQHSLGRAWARSTPELGLDRALIVGTEAAAEESVRAREGRNMSVPARVATAEPMAVSGLKTPSPAGYGGTRRWRAGEGDGLESVTSCET